MSQGPMSNSPSKGGTMRSQMPTSYQSPFGSQNYRTQTSPSKGGQPSFGGSAYQQPGQFGGQIMNRPMPSPGGKGGYQRPMMQQPMPSPGGKGGSYQRQPMPFGYGQSTFNPGQFGGYGVPSNAFSFNNPHYQPYTPPPVEPPYRGDDPRTSQTELMAEPSTQSPANSITQMEQDYYNRQEKIVDPRTAFTSTGGYNPSMPFGGKGGGAKINQMPTQIPVQDYGNVNQNRIDDQLLDAQFRFDMDQLRNPDVPVLSQQNLRRVVNRPSAPNQSLPEFLNLPRESQQPMGIAALGGGPQFTPQRRINPRLQNMR